MKILYVEPMKKPRTLDIPHDPDVMCTLVGGLIACIYPWEDEVGLIHNDNGIAEHLQPNRVVGRNIIFGPFFLAGLSEDDFTDLPDELIAKYSDLFSAPEVFLPCADGHLSVFRLVTLPDSTQAWKEIR